MWEALGTILSVFCCPFTCLGPGFILIAGLILGVHRMTSVGWPSLLPCIQFQEVQETPLQTLCCPGLRDPCYRQRGTQVFRQES